MDKASWIFAVIPPSQMIAIAFTVLCAVSTWMLTQLRTRLRGQEYDAVFDRLDKLATIVVLKLDQTLVLEAKQKSADGKLPDELIPILQSRAIAELRAMAGDKDLRRAFGDFEDAVKTLIEAKVREVRMGRKLK